MSERSRFARFLVVGSLAAGINIASRYLLSYFFIYEFTIAGAYLIAMTAAFLMNRIFVFDHSPRAAHAQYLRFAIVNAVAFVQVWLISVALARFVFPAVNFDWHPETVAHVIGVASPILTSYVGHKHYSFK